MGIPDFQTVMLPLLTLVGDDAEHSYREMFESLAQHFKLSDEERAELLPSGTQARFVNRVRWACNYLRRAGLLESTGRGRFRIADRGIKAKPWHFFV